MPHASLVPRRTRYPVHRVVALAVVAVLVTLAALTTPGSSVSARGQKVIVVSISQQVLWAYKGADVVLSTYVSTGKTGFDTPLGSYAILTKLPSQTMEGVIGGEYYNVPDVPSVMYFTNSGHALHGAYWHTSFGTPMSHGCVNLPLDIAAWLYQWAPLGTPVMIVP